VYHLFIWVILSGFGPASRRYFGIVCPLWLGLVRALMKETLRPFCCWTIAEGVLVSLMDDHPNGWLLLLMSGVFCIYNYWELLKSRRFTGALFWLCRISTEMVRITILLMDKTCFPRLWKLREYFLRLSHPFIEATIRICFCSNSKCSRRPPTMHFEVRMSYVLTLFEWIFERSWKFISNGDSSNLRLMKWPSVSKA
jgi:hypothetical protein